MLPFFPYISIGYHLLLFCFFFGLMCPDGRRSEERCRGSNILHFLNDWSNSCWFTYILYISLYNKRTRSGPPPQQLWTSNRDLNICSLCWGCVSSEWRNLTLSRRFHQRQDNCWIHPSVHGFGLMPMLSRTGCHVYTVFPSLILIAGEATVMW